MLGSPLPKLMQSWEEKQHGRLFLVTSIDVDTILTNSCTYVSYFECVPVGIENIERDFNVLLDTLATPFKLPPLQGQIQVIACVT